MSLVGNLRNIEEAVGAMRNLHQLLVHRFVALHGVSACDALTHETDQLRNEILHEIAQQRDARTDVSSDHVEYDPDDVEEEEVQDAQGAPTGKHRPKLFAPPLQPNLVSRIAVVRASHHSEGHQCIVCQEDICYGQQLCLLPVCGHELCLICCHQWLAICGSCPVCRRVISVEDFASSPDDAAVHVPCAATISKDSIVPVASCSAAPEGPNAFCFHKGSDAHHRQPLQPPSSHRQLRPSSSPASRVPPSSTLGTSCGSDDVSHAHASSSCPQPRVRPASSSAASFRHRVALASANQSSDNTEHRRLGAQQVGTPYHVFALPQPHAYNERTSHAIPQSTSNRTRILVRPSSAPVVHARLPMRTPLELAPAAQWAATYKGMPKNCPHLQCAPVPTSVASPSAHQVLVASRVRPVVQATNVRDTTSMPRPSHSAARRAWGNSASLEATARFGSNKSRQASSMFVGGTSLMR